MHRGELLNSFCSQANRGHFVFRTALLLRTLSGVGVPNLRSLTVLSPSITDGAPTCCATFYLGKNQVYRWHGTVQSEYVHWIRVGLTPFRTIKSTGGRNNCISGWSQCLPATARTSGTPSFSLTFTAVNYSSNESSCRLLHLFSRLRQPASQRWCSLWHP